MAEFLVLTALLAWIILSVYRAWQYTFGKRFTTWADIVQDPCSDLSAITMAQDVSGMVKRGEKITVNGSEGHDGVYVVEHVTEDGRQLIISHPDNE